MTEQGIPKENINLWVDEHNDGNLRACIKSFESVANITGGTWHLQDDVLISSNFKAITEEEDKGIKCGFASKYDKGKAGKVWTKDAWYSFPCIRIPNPIVKDFLKWFDINKSNFDSYVKKNKYDDALFQAYLKEHFPWLQVTNIAPNLVEHVDWLIGGSITNPRRDEKREVVRSVYWNEPGLVQKLKNSL